jgi:hypothetical protein
MASVCVVPASLTSHGLSIFAVFSHPPANKATATPQQRRKASFLEKRWAPAIPLPPLPFGVPLRRPLFSVQIYDYHPRPSCSHPIHLALRSKESARSISSSHPKARSSQVSWKSINKQTTTTTATTNSLHHTQPFSTPFIDRRTSCFSNPSILPRPLQFSVVATLDQSIG